MNAIVKPRIRVGTDGIIRGQVPAPAAPMPAPARGRATGQYMRGEQSPVFFGWNPVLRDSREDVRSAYWRAAARTVDTLHNSGWIAGIVRKGKASVLGTGLRLALKPDFEAIGWTHEESSKWARTVEKRWEAWAENPLECDASGKWTVHQQADAAMDSYYSHGEWLARMRWISRPQSQTRTKLQLVPAHWLTQESNSVDLYQGIRIDRDGMPVAYRLRLKEPLLDSGTIYEIPARDGARRPVVRHCFEGRVGQMRGISPFAPVLQVLRQYDQLANATGIAANLQALFAATITSAAATPEVLQAFQSSNEQGLGGDFDGLMDARAGWYAETNVDLGGMGRMAHLFPGEKLEFMRSETPNANFEPFARFLLRETAACGGFTAEDLTGDYTGATYSSIKMSTTTNWPIQNWRRAHIAAPFYQTAFECWLEEDIESGLTLFPGGIEGFLALRSAACRSNWRGPPKPVPDEMKFALANQILLGMNATTAEQICADNGMDWEDVFEQLKREKDLRAALGLSDPVLGGGSAPKIEDDGPAKPATPAKENA